MHGIDNKSIGLKFWSENLVETDYLTDLDIMGGPCYRIVNLYSFEYTNIL
jgi:hypothetical protein